MSEQKRWTAHEMRQIAATCQTAVDVDGAIDEFYKDEIRCADSMLRQAAETEEENATLRTGADLYKGAAENWERRAKQAEARLEAVVKVAKKSGLRKKDCYDESQREKHNSMICEILRAARGESENENK